MGIICATQFLIFLQALNPNFLFFFLVTFELFVIVEKRPLNKLTLIFRFGNNDFINNTIHKRIVVFGNRKINSKATFDLLLFSVKHIQNQFIDRIIVGIHCGNQNFRRCLSKTIDTTVALLHTVGIPRKVVMYHSVKSLLKVDSFRKTVGAYKYVTWRFRKIVNLDLALFISQSGCDDSDRYIFELFSFQFFRQVLPNIFSSLNILTEYNGIITIVESKRNKTHCLFNLVVGICLNNSFQLTDKLRQSVFFFANRSAIGRRDSIIAIQEVFQRVIEFIYTVIADWIVGIYISRISYFVLKHGDAGGRT